MHRNVNSVQRINLQELQIRGRKKRRAVSINEVGQAAVEMAVALCSRALMEPVGV